jgi:hypothetical protein
MFLLVMCVFSACLCLTCSCWDKQAHYRAGSRKCRFWKVRFWILCVWVCRSLRRSKLVGHASHKCIQYWRDHSVPSGRVQCGCCSLNSTGELFFYHVISFCMVIIELVVLVTVHKIDFKNYGGVLKVQQAFWSVQLSSSVSFVDWNDELLVVGITHNPIEGTLMSYI